jgi:hypothetical protein
VRRKPVADDGSRDRILKQVIRDGARAAGIAALITGVVAILAYVFGRA